MATVSEYIFDFLSKKGCKTVFMVSGSSAMWLTDALKRNKEVNVICNHHEQAAAMSADACGRLSAIPGVALVTIGPGATNAITGVAEAYVDSSPMIVLSGQASSKLLKYEIETGIRQHGTQSINLEPIVKPITKYFAAVMEPKDIRYHMEKAYYEAISGRPGPVWIDVPVDVQNKQIPSEDEMEGFQRELNGKKQENISKDRLNTVIALLKKAKKPLILTGYGMRTSGAVSAFREFLNKYNIPVVTSRGGIDVIDSCSKLFVGRPGGYGDRSSHFAIQRCDLLIILGSRLSVSTTGYYPEKFGQEATKIMVDIDEKELAKQDVPIDIKLNMDVKEFVSQLSQKIEATNPLANYDEWVSECYELREKYPNVIPKYADEKPLNSYYLTSVLTKHAAKDAIVVVDTGSVCNIVSQSWEIKEEQRYLISGGLSCMGFWASAIGASTMASVIAITGDGSAQMNIQEFATMKFNNLPIKLFIYNNNGYMLIRHNQHNYMSDRFLGVGPDSGLQTPDFCKVANAYGIKSVRITENDDIHEKIAEVLDSEGPVICEVMVQEFGDIVPRIASKVMPDGSLKAAEFDDLYPFLNE
nr:thiamine pyrophosphate-binding protein [uncultured Aminipila sp.]